MSLNAAVIGLGSFGSRHIRTIQKLGLGKVSAIVTRKKSNRLVPDAAIYRTAEELFSHERPDLLIITIPPSAHGDAEALAAEHSVPFFVEKPVSNDAATALSVLEKVEKSGIITSVGYHSRYSPAIERAKAAISESEPLSIEGYWIDGMPYTPWWRKKAESGGQAVEQATHIVDILRYLFGDPIDVYSRGRKALKAVDFESSSETIITFPAGRIATLSVSCEKEKGSRIGFTIGFADGSAEYMWNGKLSIRNSKGTATAGPENPNALYEEELSAFFKAVETGDRSLIKSDYRNGVKTLITTLAMNESMRKAKPVKMKNFLDGSLFQ